jgi:hypothetical protein
MDAGAAERSDLLLLDIQNQVKKARNLRQRLRGAQRGRM